jgi:hypothetical protein
MNADTQEFFDGQEIAEVHFPAPNDIYFIVGREGVERITVVMEKGQMERVAWFAIWKNGRIDGKCNSVYVANVKEA